MAYKTKRRIKVFTANTTVNDTDFSGWMAVNTGTTPVEVERIRLQPDMGLNLLQAVPKDSTWDSPIQIVVPEGGEVTLYQLIHKEIADDNSLLFLLRKILRKLK